MDEYCSKFGFPETIHLDNGREFVNNLWQESCERLQITKTTTSTCNTQSNIVERWNRTLNTMLKVFMERDDKEWAQYLPAMTLACNTKVYANTGVTPFYATFGTEARVPADPVIPTPEKNETGQNQHIKRFQRIYAYMRNNQEAAIRINAKVYPRKIHANAKDEKVWYLYPRRIKIKPVKLMDEWVGPYKITEQVAVLYKIMKDMKSSCRRLNY